MPLWRGLLLLCLMTSTMLSAYTTSKISGAGIGAGAPPPPTTPPPINTKLSPNPKKVTRPKPNVHAKYLAKPSAAVGLVPQNQSTSTENLTGVRPDLQIDVHLFAPQDERFGLTVAKMEEVLLHELHLCRIKSGQEATINSSQPRPHLLLEAYVQPINDYYAVFMDMRLIEAACPNRITLRPGEVFQGITWERKQSFCTEKYDITAVVLQKTEDMVIEFSTKYLSDQPAPPIPPQAVTRMPSKPVKAPPPKNR